ncbi:MAG: hypothetical protein ACJ8OJ_13135 [Povalibacter sp.]
MTPADRRITELIDKWLASVDLHLQYVELSDAAYARTQQWPKHDRPTRWVLEVARQKILELKAHCETRQTMGDSRFAESLELMAFLANLVGIQHIQRFIPLADPSREEPPASMSQTVEAPIAQRPQAPRPRPAADDTTREMPRLKPASVAPKIAAAPVKPAAAAVPRPEAAKAAPRSQPADSVASSKSASADLKAKMMADAVRLLKWGKPWHELAELIGRIADRPPVPEIRKFLRANKSDIEARAAKSP